MATAAVCAVARAAAAAPSHPAAPRHLARLAPPSRRCRVRRSSMLLHRRPPRRSSATRRRRTSAWISAACRRQPSAGLLRAPPPLWPLRLWCLHRCRWLSTWRCLCPLWLHAPPQACRLLLPAALLGRLPLVLPLRCASRQCPCCSCLLRRICRPCTAASAPFSPLVAVSVAGCLHLRLLACRSCRPRGSLQVWCRRRSSRRCLSSRWSTATATRSSRQHPRCPRHRHPLVRPPPP